MTISILLALFLLLGQAGPAPAQIPTASQPVCIYQDGGRPDQDCTPGATDPRVTQDNLAETICRAGWTRTVRPPTTYTNALKRQQMAAYGVADQPLSGWVEDHLIALEIGGAPRDPANLFPQPVALSRQKDMVENAARRAVCRGDVLLVDAQQAMASDWYGLGVALGVLEEIP